MDKTEKRTKPVYEAMALLLQAMKNCENNGNIEWLVVHRDQLEALATEWLPSGSGFDNGSTIDIEMSSPDKLVFRTSFHHMNDVGMYDGWTEHIVRVRASLAFGINISISGRDQNDIKEYIHECFNWALNHPIEQ